MARRDIIAVACKVLGLAMLVQTVELVSTTTIWQSLGTTEGWKAVFALGFTFALYGLTAGVLIRGADAIAAFIDRTPEPADLKPALDKHTLLQVAFVAVGVFTLAVHFANLPYILLEFSMRVPKGASGRAWADLAAFSLQLGIGLGLILGSSRLAGKIADSRSS